MSISSGIAREIREYERMSTTVGERLRAAARWRSICAGSTAACTTLAPGAPLRIMVSSGGFTSGEAAAETPILLLESGPAGGVLSALNTARINGIDQILAFDMGGTTAKACVAVGGEPLIAHSFEAARVHRFKRGSGLPDPDSEHRSDRDRRGRRLDRARERARAAQRRARRARAPIRDRRATGRAAPRATVTDADLVLGYLNADNFLGGEMKLRRDLARSGARRSSRRSSSSRTTEVAWGICNIVNENMAAAARIHIAEKGHDPREFAMVATGGAGPVHAVEVARKLQIPRVLATIAAGAGSCLGLLAAPARVDRSWSNPSLVKDIDWKRVAQGLRGAARRRREASSRPPGAAAMRRIKWWIGAEMRYAGQGHNVSVSLPWQAIGKATEAALHEGIREALSPALRPSRAERGAAGDHLAAHRALGREEPPLHVGRRARVGEAGHARQARDLSAAARKIRRRCRCTTAIRSSPARRSRARSCSKSANRRWWCR